MHVHASQSVQLSRLFTLLSQGERLAHHSAKQQSKIMLAEGNTSQAKFLKTQAKQELFHARIFDSTIMWLGGNKHRTRYQCLDKYAGYLEVALRKGTMTESVLATQVVLESLGKLALQGIDSGMEKQGLGLRKIRSAILAQEDEHHDFGQYELYKLAQQTNITQLTLQNQARQYLELAFDILDEAEPLFENLNSDIDCFKQKLISEMPSYLNLAETNQ